MRMDLDFGRSTTLPTSDLGVPDMARPLPCWCRTGRYVPLDENPLIQWVRRQREYQAERCNREGSAGVGRGRPLLVFSSSETSSSSDDDTDYVGAYRRIEERVVVPSRHNHPEHRAGRAVPPAGQSSRWGTASRMMHASSSSGAQARPEERRRGFAGAAAAATPRAAASSATVRARCPPLTTSRALRGRPAMAPRGQQYQHAAAGEAATTSGGQGGGDREDFRALRTRGAQMQAVQQSTRRQGSFDPAEFTHAFDLTAWRQSWPEGPDHDDEEAGEDEEDEEDEGEDDLEEADDEEDDDEDEPRHRPIQGESSLEDEEYYSSAASVLSTELAYSTVPSPSPPPAEEATPPTASTPAPAPAAAAEPAPRQRAYTRRLEVRGLLETATVESVFDVVSSFTPVDDVVLFRADGRLGAQVILLEEVPLEWICKCVEAALTLEEYPKPLVFGYQV